MELGPWAPCIDRLATTPAEARALLADAVAILEARAACLATTGERVWEPTPELPALVIVVDEYAELAETAADATTDADSIARRGRAVAVTLIAATQRPTQKAMGQGALRSQMDVRICFRVRERKDVDLILGQGMLAAGWQAHTLNAPGKFLISASEHDTPRRARAYLVTDEMVDIAADHYATYRPTLDDISLHGLTERAETGTPTPTDAQPARARPDAAQAPEAVLWAVLSIAPDDGMTVPDLMAETGMSRPWVYQRLQELVRTGQVTQVSRGRWRAATDHPQ
jgi:S-DNA-T family DNA segregation ATPase FtsK/SpoIIIE